MTSSQPFFAGVELTTQSIQQTRDWYADNYRECLDDAQSGKIRVNDYPEYESMMIDRINSIICGEQDHTFSFLQRAYYSQTGKSVALLNF